MESIVLIVGVWLVALQSTHGYTRGIWERKDGRCGSKFRIRDRRAHCDARQIVNGTRSCCSSYGWCGDSDAHCGVKSGKANDGRPKKPTTSDERFSEETRQQMINPQRQPGFKSWFKKLSFEQRLRALRLCVRPCSRTLNNHVCDDRGQTHDNECLLGKANCYNLQKKKPMLKIAYRSRCIKAKPAATSDECKNESKENGSNETLHVDAAHGSVEETCGSPTNPCKYLEQAVLNCKEGARVIIHGTQTLTSTIEISKDISIDGADGATITGKKPSLMAFVAVFPNKCRRNLTISNITFNEISVISIQSYSFVSIVRCSVHHIGNSVEGEEGEKLIENKTALHMTSDSDGTLLEVKYSRFTGWKTGFVLKIDPDLDQVTPTLIFFESCLFKDHLGIWLPLNQPGKRFLEKDTDKYTVRHTRIVSLVISNSEFINIMGIAIDVLRFGKLSLTNSSFKRNKKYEGMKDSGRPIHVEEALSCIISDCEFKDGNDGSIYITSSPVIIERSVFTRNVVNESSGDVSIHHSKATLLGDCLFAYSKAIGTGSNGGSVYISEPLGELLVSNCTFVGNNATMGGAIMVLTIIRKSPIMFQKCRFYRNRAMEGGGGAIAISARGTEVVSILLCVFVNNSGYIGGGIMVSMYSKKLQVTIRNSIFTNNEAMAGGGLYAREDRKKSKLKRIQQESTTAKVLLLNCAFQNNSATSMGQSIYSNDHIKIENITVITFERFSSPHLSLESGNIDLQGISVRLSHDSRFPLSSKSRGIELKSKEVKISSGLLLICPISSRLEDIKIISEQISKKLEHNRFVDNKNIEETKYYYLSVDCEACPYATYTRQNGRLDLPELSKAVPPQNNFTTQPVKCEICPTGAICDVDVKAVDNYWGFEHLSKLSFILCPNGYCCGTETTPCLSINTCAVGRSGLLCGSCASGYKQNFVANDCIPQGQNCDAKLFITYFVIYTVTYSLAFVLITNIKDILVQLKRKFLKKDPIIDSAASNDDEISLAGYVQRVILFFQVAGLLQVKFQGEQKEDAPRSNIGVREQISEIFSFRYVLYQQLCPSDDLTLPSKEMILFGMKMTTFIHLLILALVSILIESLRRCLNCQNSKASTLPVPTEEPPLELAIKENPSTTGTEEEKVFIPLSFRNMIKCTFIKLLKMYYTPVTKCALTLIHCINIRNSSHLYVYGDHLCYSSWQYAIMFIVLPGLLVFPFSFEVALRLLKRKHISSWQFVAATACPYIALFLHVWKRNQRRKRESVSVGSNTGNDEDCFRYTILEGEELLFKEIEGKTLGWQVVQFYRTFAITFLSIFMINPVYRQLAYTVLLLVFTVHDFNRKPYKNQYLNHLQSLSSRCLLLVLMCNIIPAISYLVNVRTIPQIYQVVELLSAFELIIYATVPISLPLWKIKAFLNNRRAAKKNK